MRIAVAAVVAFILPFVEGESANPSGTGVIRLLNTNLCISTADDWGSDTTGYGDDLILKECTSNTPTWLHHGPSDAYPKKIINVQQIDGADRCIHPWGGTNQLNAQLKTHPVNGPEDYALDSDGRIRAGPYPADGTWLDICITAEEATANSKIYLKPCSSSSDATQLWTWTAGGGAATCDSFSGCTHSSLNKGSDVSCTGDADTCNAGTCCNQPATCDQFTGCPDDSFFKSNLGSTVQCAGASSTCNVETCCEGNHCDITEWGTGLPFSTDDDRPKFSLTDGDILDVAEFKITFKLATQTCVDNKNWLHLTLHDTQTPKCVEAAQGADNGCTALSDDEEACNDNSNCRYRIPCESSELGDSDAAPFTVAKVVSTRTAGPTQDTEFTINIDTEKLDDAENIYVKATADKPLAKLEFCVRAAVSVDVRTSDSTTSHEILYRELILRTEIGMDGSFTALEVASDSFDEDAVQAVDNTLAVTAQGFACEQDGSVYKKLDTTPTLVPNALFTLCVVPTSTSIKCDDIETLTFKQDRSNAGGSDTFSEDRIANKVPANFLLTSDPAVETVEVVEDGTTTQHIGCVVNARLEAAYFVALAPNPIRVSGSAMLAFKTSSRGRSLREESAHSSMAMAVFDKRNLQEEEQVASFDVQFKLSRNQENEVPDNNRRVDAAEHIGGYCLTTAFAAVAASNMI